MLNKILNKKAGISYLEILILIIGSFAFCYIISQSNEEIEKIYVENQEQINQLRKEKEQAKTNLLIGFLKSWLGKSKLNLVSAEEYQELEPGNTYEVFDGFSSVDLEDIVPQCCPKLKENIGEGSGSSCQEIPQVICEDYCAVDCIPSGCDKTSVCELGCCYDDEQGLCYQNVPKQDCEGGWVKGSNCNIEQCRLGCCVLGRQTQFITERKCEILSNFYTSSFDFRPGVDTEIDCLLLANQQDLGACVIETQDDFGEIQRTCKFTTKLECIDLGGVENFYKDSLCTNPELDTNCEITQDTTCVDGKDEVYFVDSCGNPANIYDSLKINSGDYWSYVVSKQDSCGSDDGNINSKSCGNCNYLLGSICKSGDAKYGDFICQDLNCDNAPANGGGKQDRKNGESWCVYESYIGDGRDVVGSRHYRYYCIDGKVKSDPCADYRKGICFEEEVEGFSIASCRLNRAMECISYNTEADGDEDTTEDDEKISEKCHENPDCEIRSFDFGHGYRFNICTPRYPIGFDMENNQKAAEAICDGADFKCTKVMVKDWKGKWKCKAGCYCTKETFTQAMNDWCVSLGDCGGYVNYIGEGRDDGYSVTNAPEIDIGQYEKYANAKSGQNTEQDDKIMMMLASAYGWNANIDEDDYSKDYGDDIWGGVVGAGGVGYLMAYDTVISWGTGYLNFAGGLFPAFGAALIGAAIGAAAGLMIANWLDIEGEGALAMAAAGAIIGFIAALWIIGAMDFWNPIGWGAIILAILIMIYTWAVGWGDTKTTTVTFNCDPYRPLRGGNDCEICQDEATDLQPCTRYKCQSLGETCEFINAGTTNELCIDISPNDISPPKISPWNDILSPGFEYKQVSENGYKLLQENGECIPEYTPIIFGISTEQEPSQCRYDVVHTQDYDEMSSYLGESSLFKYNHMMTLNMPSVESLLANMQDDLTQEELANLESIALDKLGDLTFYVRCEDKSGNSNLKEYLIQTCVKAGPDMTGPYITQTSPDSDNYLTYNETEQDLDIWVSEPADCRWSKSSKDYELMENNFICNQNFDDVELYGWKCKDELENLTTGDNKIYIRCKDQPHKDEGRNIGALKELVLKRSESELKINSIKPEGELMFGVEPVTATLRVETSGGAENGKSKCEYSFTNSNYILMKNTYSSSHSQEFNQLLRGRYNVYVECEDIAGNIAKGKTEFKIKIDSKPPQVVRVYSESGLKIITDEDAECVYDYDNCFYLWNNASSMTGILKEHTASLIQGKTYYIKCKDIYDNKPDTCSIIVKSG